MSEGFGGWLNVQFLSDDQYIINIEHNRSAYDVSDFLFDPLNNDMSFVFNDSVKIGDFEFVLDGSANFKIYEKEYSEN